jgi:hypothetical protein
MVKTNISSKKLHDIEIKLNQIRFKDFGIGSVLSFYFDRLYLGDFDNRFFRYFTLLGYYFIKSISQKNYLKDYQKNIIYFKSGNKRHHKGMQDAISYAKNLKHKTLIIGPKGASDLYKGKIFYNSNLITLFKIIIFLIANIYKISASIKPLKINLKTSATLYLYLVIQLLKAHSLKMFIIEQIDVKLIGADYDRGNDSSLFFIVAKALKVKNFTLQHGVINPPNGYSPINAEEIWVWGKMARLQLMKLGVDEKKIIITGTPIIQELKILKEIRKIALDKYKLESGKTIVLALSSPNKSHNLIMISFLAEMKKEFASSIDNFLVKIHPSHDISNYLWISDDYNIQLLPYDISHENFMNITDILLAHNSGLANEALFYKKKIGILDILDEEPKNGLELNKYLHVPIIKCKSMFKELLDSESIIYDTELIYYKIGAVAKKEITNRITQLID